MKKTILGILAATTILATNVSVMNSAHAAGSCSGLDKGVQFNKTELSAFDKCWLNTHRADKKSGIDGNVFWVKIKDKFISMPLIDIRNAGSETKAKEMIKDKVIDTALVDKLTQDITDKVEMIETLKTRIATLAPLASQVPGLNDEITRLSQEVQRLMGIPKASSVGISRVTVSDSGTIRAHSNDSRTWVFYNAVEVEDNHRTTITKRAGSIGTFDISGANPNTGRSPGVLFNQDYVDNTINNTGGQIARSAIASAFGVSFTSVTGPALNEDLVNYIRDTIEAELAKKRTAAFTTNAPVRLNHFDSVITAYGKTIENGNYANVDNGHDGFRASRYQHHINGDYIELLDQIDVDALTADVNAAVAEAYADGYSDGYDAGYADGYRDGYTDGVNSVTQ